MDSIEFQIEKIVLGIPWRLVYFKLITLEAILKIEIITDSLEDAKILTQSMEINITLNLFAMGGFTCGCGLNDVQFALHTKKTFFRFLWKVYWCHTLWQQVGRFWNSKTLFAEHGNFHLQWNSLDFVWALVVKTKFILFHFKIEVLFKL